MWGQRGGERHGTGRLDRTEPIGQHRAKDVDHLPIPIIDGSEFAADTVDRPWQQPVAFSTSRASLKFRSCRQSAQTYQPKGTVSSIDRFIGRCAQKQNFTEETLGIREGGREWPKGWSPAEAR